MNLTAKQEQFCQEYIIDFNATQAAIRAGYSRRTAGKTGSELIKKPEIQARLKGCIADRVERTHITQDWVVNRIADHADLDITEIFSWDEYGNITVKTPEEIPAETRKLICEVSMVEFQTDKFTKRNIKVKLADKLEALKLLYKHTSEYGEQKETAPQIDSTRILEAAGIAI